MKYQLIFSRSRSGVLGATTIDSQGVLIFYENSYRGEMWPLSLKLAMPRSDLKAMRWHLKMLSLCVWEPVLSNTMNKRSTLTSERSCKIFCVNTNIKRRKAIMLKTSGFRLIPHFHSVSKSNNFLIESDSMTPQQNDKSKNSGLKQSEPQMVFIMPYEALRLYLWSHWSECQIHNKVCCPSSSVICSHQSQEDSSQVHLISLSRSRTQIDSHHLHFLHGQIE